MGIIFLILVILILLPLVPLAIICLQEHRSDRVPALLYHRLRPGRNQPGQGSKTGGELLWCVFGDSFRAQMEWLKENGYNAINFDEFLDWQEGRGNLPPHPVIISFDDGYRSVYELAFPVLKRLGLRATVFLTTDFGSPVFDPFKPDDGPLDEAMVREMHASGVIDIQCHGHRHLIMTAMGRQGLAEDLEKSRAVVRELTGRDSDVLAVPNGFYDRMVEETARASGFRAMVIAGKGSNHRGSHPFRLRRMPVERNDGLDRFEALLKPGPATLARLVGWIKSFPAGLFGHQRWDNMSAAVHGSTFSRLFTLRALGAIILALYFLLLGAAILAGLAAFR